MKIEEAKHRDHRVLGKQLDLFAISPMVGSGLILWLPKGAIIRSLLENFVRDELVKRGYQTVYTPNIGKVDLYKISGHFPYYADSMFPPTRHEGKSRRLSAQADELPASHHDLQGEAAVYRDLPVRLAEFGTVYRYEQSGELGGMTRVRGFTQDDAHIFCTEDQVAGEFRGCLEMTQFVLEVAGPEQLPRAARLPRSDERQVRRSAEQWDRAEGVDRRRCAAEMNLPTSRSNRARRRSTARRSTSSCATASVASGNWAPCSSTTTCRAPQRFDLEYTGADNKPHRPVMIHRAPLGSMERFIGVLIEQPRKDSGARSATANWNSSATCSGGRRTATDAESRSVAVATGSGRETSGAV